MPFIAQNLLNECEVKYIRDCVVPLVAWRTTVAPLRKGPGDSATWLSAGTTSFNIFCDVCRFFTVSQCRLVTKSDLRMKISDIKVLHLLWKSHTSDKAYTITAYQDSGKTLTLFLNILKKGKIAGKENLKLFSYVCTHFAGFFAVQSSPFWAQNRTNDCRSSRLRFVTGICHAIFLRWGATIAW